MPGRDGTGPMGMGRMTGRKLGVCTGINAPNYGNGFGRGCGRGFGRGLNRGFGRGFDADYTSKEALQAQKKELQFALDSINKRLEGL